MLECIDTLSLIKTLQAYVSQFEFIYMPNKHNCLEVETPRLKLFGLLTF